MSIVGKALSGLLEEEYVRQRNEAAQTLHNALVEVINEQQPSVETAIYVLELLQLGILQRKIKAQGPGQTAAPMGWRAEREKERGSRVAPDTSRD
ncbi:MAG TPA: hypothetical protein VMY35_16590 [Phycisphaerae bacterium]|nr:hypothetical protein [Phycisphaerae bacterium]